MNNYTVIREIWQGIVYLYTFVVTARKSRYLPVIAVAPTCAAFFFGALSLPAFGQAPAGLVGGVARDFASGKPVAEAIIIAHNLRKGTDRSTVSDADGSFAFINLEPGSYEVAATKNGFQKASAQVNVAARQTARVELPLRLATEKSDDPPLTAREKQMLDRISRLEGLLAAPESTDVSKNTIRAEPILTAAATPPAAAEPAAAPAPAPAPAAVPPAPPSIPEGLQAPESIAGVDNFTPFAYGDFSWLNGSSRSGPALDTKFFTPEIRFDTHFMVDFNQPIDHTMGGSTEAFRSGEVQLEQISVGGDFHWQNVRGRILTMNGMFAVTTPRNDGSAGVGQWDVRGAYRYVSEAYGGYHFDVNHGLNVDAGIFVSYIGLFSYYNFDNWAYQPSFVSSNTPWFFNGVRIQWFPTNKLKIEPWIINGWQSYNKFNGHRGFGGQILYMPKEWLKLVFNNYGNGTDTLGVPDRSRLHTDDSIEVRYINRPESTGLSKMAFSFTADAGCEYGGGVTCHGGKGGPKQSFLGWMAYNRMWFGKDKYALTIGGGQMNNQGRYLTLLPPINGADAVSGLPRHPGIRPTCGTPILIFSGCRRNTLHGGWKAVIVTRMCRIGRAAEALRLPVETLGHQHNTSARPADRRGQTIWRQHTGIAVDLAVSGSPIFGEATVSAGVMVKF